MKLVSVNVGSPRDVVVNGRTIRTGIFKTPVADRLRVDVLNIEGDGQADLSVHGGVDMAVYAYPHEHYATWGRELGRQDLTMGQFGENLTTEGLLEADVRIGDVLAIGSTRLQVTQPRVPCYKLAMRMEMPQFPKLFMKSLRTGFYLRVLQEGEIGAGDDISRVATDLLQMTVCDVFVAAYGGTEDRAVFQRAFEMPALSRSWREDFAERLGLKSSNP